MHYRITAADNPFMRDQGIKYQHVGDACQAAQVVSDTTGISVDVEVVERGVGRVISTRHPSEEAS